VPCFLCFVLARPWAVQKRRNRSRWCWDVNLCWPMSQVLDRAHIPPSLHKERNYHHGWRRGLFPNYFSSLATVAKEGQKHLYIYAIYSNVYMGYLMCCIKNICLGDAQWSRVESISVPTKVFPRHVTFTTRIPVTRHHYHHHHHLSDVITGWIFGRTLSMPPMCWRV